jgi:hypothetical protein
MDVCPLWAGDEMYKASCRKIGHDDGDGCDDMEVEDYKGDLRGLEVFDGEDVPI